MINLQLKLITAIFLFFQITAFASEKQEYSFGVIAQRSATLTAQIWNPIFAYVESKTGIKLILKTTRTGPESKQATDAGEYDFAYSNVVFDAKKIIYIPILQPDTEPISSQIVTLPNSNIKTLQDLNNKQIGFPSKIALMGYLVPADFLRKHNIVFTEVFAANQEGIMAQLKSGSLQVAAVNSSVMKSFADREKMQYVVIWESQKFPDIPIVAHERVPVNVVKKVQETIASMSNSEDGKKVLAEIKEKTKQDFNGFKPANMQTYKPYIDFYKNISK